MIQILTDFLCCVTGGSASCGLLLLVGIVALVNRSTASLGPPRSVDKISRSGERYSPEWDSYASSDSSRSSVVRRCRASAIRGCRL